MAETVKDIKQWLNTLPDEAEVGIDDGGLALRVIDSLDTYYEIGGLPSDEDEESEVRQTACRHCGQDIENFRPFPAGEWRDRDATGKLFDEVTRSRAELKAYIEQRSTIHVPHLDGDLASITSSLEQLAKCVDGSSFRVLCEKYEI